MRQLFSSNKLQVLSLVVFLMPVINGFAQTVPNEMMIGNVRLSINQSARKQIQSDVDRLTKSPTYYNILVDRMNLYFPYIEMEHKKAGIPDEIKFLAIQESALISDAVSSANAVGYWQFKDFTAREVGLIVDRKVDERLNIISSSRGSAKYFNTNNFFFDNWAYAVIAYQAGATGSKSHTDQSKYGSKRLNITPGTYWYLKKFIAHVVAFSPAVGRPHSEKIWLEQITDIGGKSLGQIAKRENVDIEELKKYNKWIKRGNIPTDKTYSVMVPRKGTPPKTLLAEKSDDPDKGLEIEAKIYPTELRLGITEEKKSTIILLNGIPSVLALEFDDVNSLSARARIKEKKFRKYNDMDHNDQVMVGKFYYIKKKKNKTKVEIHIAKQGESLWGIAQKYGIKLSKLVDKNHMSIIDELNLGMVLWINKKRPSGELIAYYTGDADLNAKPTSSTSEQDAKTSILNIKKERLKKVKIHTVAPNESLSSIAKIYEVKLKDLLRWNELPNPNAIKVGQNIQVKAPIEEISKGKNIINHTVQPNQTLYAISRKYDMTVDEIMELNKISSTNLEVNQVLKVYGKSSTDSE